MHLLDERLRSIEAPLAAQALDELEAQALPVEIAVEVEQICLDQLAAPRFEGRAYADRDGRSAAVGKARVDAVTRTHVVLLRDQVRRRKAELAPALVAVHDLAAQLEGAAEQPVRLAQLAGEHKAADMARGDDLAVDLEQGVHGRREALVGLQQPRVALRLVPEAEVLADRDAARAERADEHVLDELLRRALGEAGVERDHDKLLHAERGDQLGLARGRRQQLRRVLWRDNRDRVWIERQHRVGIGDHLAVTEVHAVKRADRDAASVAALDVGQAGDLHSRTA